MSKQKPVRYIEQEPKLPKNGKSWSYNGKIRTVETEEELVKNAKAFKNSQMTATELAYECYEIWKGLQYKGNPSSPAAFFRKWNRSAFPKIPYSANVIFAEHFRGGWSEAFCKGFNREHLSYYDLRLAYFWSAISEGLPYEILPIRKDSKSWLALLQLPEVNEDLPTPLRTNPVVMDNVDVQLYGIEKYKVLFGVELKDFQETEQMFSRVFDSELPEPAKKAILQSYWGSWISNQKVKCNIHREGEVVSTSELPNRDMNFVWGNLIVHRVLRRMYENSPGSVLVAFDAILTANKLHTGDNPGDFRVKHEFPEGVYVRNSGLWTPIKPGEELPEEKDFQKHMGKKK